METLRLTEHLQRGGRKPSSIEVTVFGRKPIQATESPTGNVIVCLNLAWIELGEGDPNRLSRFIPGGFIIPEGLSGKRELLVETHEVWTKDGSLDWAKALDPRPIHERTRRFAVMGT